MQFKFLVDVNLPKNFSHFNNKSFIHVVDINPSMTDSEIWDYAINNNFVILTKDSDFYFQCIISKVRPKIIYFQLGNQTLREMHQYFAKNWKSITELLSKSDLILAREKSIQIIL